MNRFTIFLWVRYFNCKDLLTTMCRFWTNPKFALIDCTLLLSYFFKSPYSIGREHNEAEPYGETPLATLDLIIKHCPIKSGDTVLELGSGRGRTCFWLSVYKGCKTIGIEYIPAFVTRAQKFAKFFGVENVEFRLGDMLEADITQAHWIYLFGTALPDERIIMLCKKLEALPPGTKIITVSYPLTAYSSSPKFEVLESFDAQFSWGTTQVYIHEINNLPN